MGSVGGESPLFGYVGFQLGEHGVETVGEFTELVAAPRQPDPLGQRSGRGRPGGLRDSSQGREYATGENPPAYETEHQQKPQHEDCRRDEDGGAEAAWIEDAPEVGQIGNE
ncbi:hypothetical protein CJ469_06175 [Nocardia farcinica]|nr:hypothetical protein CJ469_06175 [Nocardia farcinica]PFX08220.1 hypothetical protein CJ468_02769 [Nocardia farcinica]